MLRFFLENPISIVLVSQRVPRLSHRGGCDSGGGAGKCQSPQERYENLFLSISPEPLFSQQGDKNRGKNCEVEFLFPDLFNYFGL
jgi:hypothetical protein